MLESIHKIRLRDLREDVVSGERTLPACNASPVRTFGGSPKRAFLKLNRQRSQPLITANWPRGAALRGRNARATVALSFDPPKLRMRASHRASAASRPS